MKRSLAAALVAAAGSATVACRALLGLNDPIDESVDAGGAIDAAVDSANGAPSATYPAYRPSVPRLTLSTAATIIPLPQVRGLAFPGDPLAAGIGAAGASWIGSLVWQEQTLQYGVGRGSVVGGLVTLAESAPTSITDDDVQKWLAAKLDGTHAELGAVDATTLASEVFILFYPPSTTITALGGTSCKDFNGYHGEVSVGLARTTYVVLPRCDDNAASLSTAASYELLAAVTNPHPLTRPGYTSFDDAHLAWNFLGGDGGTELPQPCKGLVTVLGDSGIPVARSWSNEAMALYHDPCVPTADTTPFFASAPVMSDEVSPPGGYPAEGIHLAVGRSKTVDVLLFSDGETSGPWTVDAYVLPGFAVDALAFEFDRTTGRNGEKLHLTVTAKRAGSIPFVVRSTLGSKQTTWAGIVGQE